jgi:hypothetical protein
MTVKLLHEHGIYMRWHHIRRKPLGALGGCLGGGSKLMCNIQSQLAIVSPPR